MELEIAPKRKPETYSREVQCEILDPKKLGKITGADEDDSDDSDSFDRRIMGAMNSRARAGSSGRGSISSGRRGSVTTGIVETVRKAAPKPQENKTVEPEAKEMSKDEAKQLMATNEFQTFLETTSRYVERALGAEFDYRGEFFIDEGENEGEDKDERGSLLVKKFTMEEKMDYRRTITSLDWHPTTPELFLASYSQLKDWGLDEPDGLINIYSIAM